MDKSITREYLESHRTQGSGYNFKALCPNCSGGNLWVTLGNGLCFCFNCAARFMVDGVVQRVVRDLVTPVLELRKVYAHAVLEYQKQLYKVGEQLRYLLRRGIREDTIQEFKIGFCSGSEGLPYDSTAWMDSGLADYRGRPSLVGRITFPYETPEHEFSDVRGRSNTETPKYKSPINPSANRGAFFPFNWTSETLHRARASKTIILTEGEIKTIIAHQLGYAAIGLPGIMSWKPGFVPDADWKIIVIFDTMKDPERRRDTDRAMARLSKKVADLYVTTLPLLGEDKMDIDSFILHKRGGESYFSELVSGAVPYTRYVQLRRV